MKTGSMFSGTTALDMAAADLFDAEPVWFADLDPAASALLAHRYPAVPNLRDITAVDWDLVALLAPVELVTAGWPCQPFSLAGKRKGAEDERALWPEVDRCLRALRPRYVLLENVPAVVGAELGRVADTLAALGYRFAWCCLPASAVGAPHRRERFFLLAVAEDADRATGGERRLAASGQAESRRPRANARGRGRAPAADSTREHERAVTAGTGRWQSEEPVGDGGASAADAARDGWHRSRSPRRASPEPRSSRVDDGPARRLDHRRSRAHPRAAAQARWQRRRAAPGGRGVPLSPHAAIPAPKHTTDPDQIPLPLENPVTETFEITMSYTRTMTFNVKAATSFEAYSQTASAFMYDDLQPDDEGVSELELKEVTIGDRTVRIHSLFDFNAPPDNGFAPRKHIAYEGGDRLGENRDLQALLDEHLAAGSAASDREA